MTATATRTRVCPSCGSTNVGDLAACLRCTAPFDVPVPPTRARSGALTRWIRVISVVLAATSAGITLWRLTHDDTKRAAASAPAESTPPAATTPPASAPVVADADTAQSCVSASGGYSVHYPAGWVTVSATTAQACHFFASKPFRATKDDTSAGDITIDTSATESYAAFVASFDEPGDASGHLEHAATTINGRDAQSMTYTYQQDKHTTYGYGYVIDHDGKPVIIATRTLDAPSDELQRIVATMAKSLELG